MSIRSNIDEIRLAIDPEQDTLDERFLDYDEIHISFGTDLRAGGVITVAVNSSGSRVTGQVALPPHNWHAYADAICRMRVFCLRFGFGDGGRPDYPIL
jgi:hypothetical protein